MLNVILRCNDSLEAILPTLARAMQAGEVCRIRNVHYLGPIHRAALSLLAMSANLMDPCTGQIVHPHPGFRLVGIDDRRSARARGG